TAQLGTAGARRCRSVSSRARPGGAAGGDGDQSSRDQPGAYRGGRQRRRFGRTGAARRPDHPRNRPLRRPLRRTPHGPTDKSPRRRLVVGRITGKTERLEASLWVACVIATALETCLRRERRAKFHELRRAGWFVGGGVELHLAIQPQRELFRRDGS